MRTSNRQLGFTIVELLIVIVVIGILAAIALVSYAGAQQRARDADRKVDIHAIGKAAELYYADNGNYPMTSGWCTQVSNTSTGWSTALQSEFAHYMPKIPYDPTYVGTYQDYFYRNVNDQSYFVYAELDSEDRADDGFTGCSRIGGLNNEYDYRYPVF